MEFKSIVFNAARDGKLRRLKLFLENRTKDEVQMMVASKTGGSTPLVISARNGHLDVLEYLLEKCGADVEQVGSVTFDGETIEGAPPLWCASAAGHLSVVKSLVRHGACVNSTTKTNSTPLRAACFDGHYEIVKYLVDNKADYEIANRHGHTCLMIACYKGHHRIAKYLMELGADVNRKSVKGNTALHDCAESGSLEIMMLLIQNKAKMDVDCYGMTPLLAAAITGHTPIVEYLIVLPCVNRRERIDGLELLGTTFVDKKHDMLGASSLWRRALEHRDSYSMGKPPGGGPVQAYGNLTEVANVQQLEDLVSNPDDMRMQALIIRERILGPAHPDTSYYIRYRGAVYADTGSFQRCIILWMYALDMQQKILEPLSPMTQSSLVSFIELFTYMLSDTNWKKTGKTAPIDFQDIMRVFASAVWELRVGMSHKSKPPHEYDPTYLNRIIVIVMHLISLLCQLQQYMSPEEMFNLKKNVYEFVKLDPQGRNGWHPLHYACYRDLAATNRFQSQCSGSTEMIQLLLDVGACANSVDNDHNTPLHIAASCKPNKPSVIRTLLDNGAHYDSKNLEGKTFEDMLKATGVKDVVNPLHHVTLKCLAARAIMAHGVSWRNQVPQRLESFVLIH